MPDPTQVHPEPTPGLHAAAVSALRDWAPPTPEQETLREAYLAFLLTGPATLTRAHAPGHVTASGIVLDATGRHVLLVLHPRAGLWLPPGGHVEAEDASLADAAVREVREETGVGDAEVSPHPIRLDAHPFNCSLGIPTRHLDVAYLLRTRPEADGGLPATVISEESLDLRWWPVDALPEPTSPRLAAQIAAAVALAAG